MDATGEIVQETEPNQSIQQATGGSSGAASEWETGTFENVDTTLDGESESKDKQNQPRAHSSKQLNDRDDDEIQLMLLERICNPNQLSDSNQTKRNKAGEIVSVTDKCDCLIPSCPGCHYPCKNCGSRGCGHVCKWLRDWNYTEVIVQGHDTIRKPVN